MTTESKCVILSGENEKKRIRRVILNAGKKPVQKRNPGKENDMKAINCFNNLHSVSQSQASLEPKMVERGSHLVYTSKRKQKRGYCKDEGIGR